MRVLGMGVLAFGVRVIGLVVNLNPNHNPDPNLNLNPKP